MTIETGDWIRVPKGTHLIKDYTKGNYGEGKAPTSRDVVVQVSAVTDIDPYYFRDLLSVEDFSEFKAGERGGRNTYGSGHTDETRATAQQIYDAALAKARSKLKGGAQKIIHWSNDRKGALDIFVEKVEAPAARKKAEVKINKRQQMVNKSRWRFTQDHDVTYVVPNPAVRAGEQAWEKANPRPGYSHSMDDDVAWRERLFAERKRLEDELGKMITTVHRKVKAGEVFTVDGKFQTYNPYGYGAEDVGSIARVLFDGDSKNTWLPYKQVDSIIEAESIPTVDVYVLRNKATGEFYKSSEYNEEATKAAQEEAKANGAKLYGIWHECAVYDPVTVEGFMKAKHFDGLGRAKTQILMMTGYYNNLPGADESLPEWAGGAGFKMDTAEWELVHFDKLARREVEVVQDFAEWYKRAWELRELTVRYGSSVRTAYKALEKANLLDSQKGMVVFTETDEEKLDNAGIYGDKTAISDEEKALIDVAIASTKMKKGTFKKAVDLKSVAVSFPNKGAAMMFKLAYNGKLKTTILDLETLTETVDG